MAKIGKLLEISTTEEVDNYFGNKLLESKLEESNKEDSITNNFIF